MPLAWASVGDVEAALVVENAGLFNVAVSVLRQLSNPPYGLVIYGAGAGVEQALPGLAELGRHVNSVVYVGDLDRAGLRIAQAAGRTLMEVGLPTLRPAPGLHERMLEAAAHLGHASGWPTRARRIRWDDDQLVSWLPEEIRPRVRALLAAGRRIPEEVLGPEELLAAWGGVG
ncbi:MAG TPA: Wadjet anti-phage system protein JetD domain-containing protein [Gemmatimonadales bacterium]